MKSDVAALIQASTSAGLAGATWVADLAEWTQLGATAVAIVAGLMAAWYHYERAQTLRKNRKEEE